MPGVFQPSAEDCCVMSTWPWAGREVLDIDQHSPALWDSGEGLGVLSVLQRGANKRTQSLFLSLSHTESCTAHRKTTGVAMSRDLPVDRFFLLITGLENASPVI